MKHLSTLAVIAALAACQGPDAARSPRQQSRPVHEALSTESTNLIVDPDPLAARGATFERVPRVVHPYPWKDRVQELRPEFLEAPVVPASPDAPDLAGKIIDPDPLASRGWR